MSIITKKIAGTLFIVSAPLILIFSSLTEFPFYVALTLLSALILILLSLVNAQWGLLILIALRPTAEFFSDRLKIDLSNSVSINLPAILGLLSILFVILFLIKLFLSDKKIEKPPLFMTLSIILFLTVNALSIFISINPLMTAYEIFRLLSIFAIFILSYLVFSFKKDFSSLIWAIIISAIIPILLSLYQLITGTGSSDLEGRLTGTFSNPNSFASFSLIIFGLFVYLFLIEKSRKRKTAYFLLAFLILFILLETLSRGAWLATLIFTTLLVFWKSPKSLIIIVLFLIILFFSSETFHNRIEDIYNPPATSSIRWRLKQWEGLSQVYQNKPFVGYGAGTEIFIHEKEFGFYAGNPYVHNDILRSALETGILGALSFLAIFFFAITTSFKNYAHTIYSERKILLLIIIFLFIAEFVFGMTSNIFRSTAVQWCLWALLGIALIKHKK